jgi:hypothetical protein
MSNGLEMAWDEVVVAWIKVLSWNLSLVNEESNEIPNFPEWRLSVPAPNL